MPRLNARPLRLGDSTHRRGRVRPDTEADGAELVATRLWPSISIHCASGWLANAVHCERGTRFPTGSVHCTRLLWSGREVRAHTRPVDQARVLVALRNRQAGWRDHYSEEGRRR